MYYESPIFLLRTAPLHFGFIFTFFFLNFMRIPLVISRILLTKNRYMEMKILLKMLL